MPLRDIVTRDLRWKLFSVVLAVIVWIAVRAISSESPSNPLLTSVAFTFTNLPVLVVSSAEDVREFKVDPDNVDVEIRTQPETLATLQDKDIHAIVDLSDVVYARYVGKRVEVSMPPGVTLINVTPREVSVVVPPRKEK